MNSLSVASLLLLALSSAAAAAPPGATPAAEQEDDAPVESYRRQTLLADGVAVALLAAGVGLMAADQDNAGGALFIGGAIAVAGAPVVHFSHGRTPAGVSSIVLRVLLPFAGGIVGVNINQCEGDSRQCGVFADADNFVYGAAGGLIAAMVVDSALLAGPAGRDEPRKAASTSGWTAIATPTLGGASVGVAGAF